MHIYYYEKDGYYYVMNEKGVLEKYSIKNNIELILKLENLINYFSIHLNEENTKFRFKTYQELTEPEKYNISQFIPFLALFEYGILQENAIAAFILQASIFNIINRMYYNKKVTIQKAENLLEDLLKELLVEFNKKLEVLKQISRYKKEIAPLSEFDPDVKKTYIDFQTDLIENFQYDIDIQIDLEINPQNIFNNNEYERIFEYEDISKEEFDYQRKIKIIKDKYLKELPEEVQQKLEIVRKKNLMESSYLIANGTMTIAMILQLIKQNMNNYFLNTYQNNILCAIIILDIIYYSIYYRTNKKLQNINEPYLRLEKKDK